MTLGWNDIARPEFSVDFLQSDVDGIVVELSLGHVAGQVDWQSGTSTRSVASPQRDRRFLGPSGSEDRIGCDEQEKRQVVRR